jgi:hypothetical protein
MEPLDDTIDVEELFREIERYLDVVAEFRAAGCDVGGWGAEADGPGRRGLSRATSDHVSRS